MDGLSGLQVLSELKWMKLPWPVIVMSGEAGGELVTRALASGAHAVLAKPFDEPLLERTLAKAFLALAPTAAARQLE
jgi:FixJ family two-component response regulator